MRGILIFAAVVLLGGAYAARFADYEATSYTAPRTAPARETVAAAPAPTESSGRSMTLEPDAQGHFRTEAKIDGQHIDFMVDTGASLVALRESDAGMLGIHPMPSDYTATVVTANGKVKAARAKLDRIALGDITVFDVPALVLPDAALNVNLLGVTFLSRLKRYEYANGRMVLEQ
jgi:aspartyl protease family protein